MLRQSLFYCLPLASNNTKEDLISPPVTMTRSNSIATERAHSLESEKLDKLDHLKNPDSTITLSWNDVSGSCNKPGCQGWTAHCALVTNCYRYSSTERTSSFCSGTAAASIQLFRLSPIWFAQLPSSVHSF